MTAAKRAIEIDVAAAAALEDRAAETGLSVSDLRAAQVASITSAQYSENTLTLDAYWSARAPLPL